MHITTRPLKHTAPLGEHELINRAWHERPTSRRQRRARPVILVLGLVIALGISGGVEGTTFLVTKEADTLDGACDGDCSVREAVVAANANPGLDFIVLPAGRFTLSIPGADEDVSATGDLDITDATFVSGQGPAKTIIDADGLGDRVINQNAGGHQVVLVGLTVTGGWAPTDGGGIWNQDGTLVLSNVVVRDNVSTNSGGGVKAYLAEVIVKDGSAIISNSASSVWYGGGIMGNNLTVTDSTISGNSAGVGGGISTEGTLTVSGSTISYNQDLGFDGGGIWAGAGTLDISNGGGADVTLNSVTFSGNSAPSGETIRIRGGSSVNFINTLISGSCILDSGSTVSYGGNLESGGDTCGLVDSTDQVNVVDPLLAPLAHNGGSTRTMLPLSGSPAIGGGSDWYCLNEDQRGEIRGDGNCDIGAVERQPGEQDPVFIDGFESGDTGAW